MANKYLDEEGLAILWDKISRMNDWVQGGDRGSSRNCLYRGKNITENFNDGSFFESISNGTFDDIFIGDYFELDVEKLDGTVLSNFKFYIGHINKYYNFGDSGHALATNHVLIVPSGTLGSAAFNSTNTTSGGYIGSNMYTTTLNQVKQNLITAGIPSEHFIQRRAYYSNAVSSNQSTGGEWVDSDIWIPSEAELTGLFTGGHNFYHDIGIDYGQLALFRCRPMYINIKNNYWIRNVVSSSQFGFFDGTGLVSGARNASESAQVRPFFLLG